GAIPGRQRRRGPALIEALAQPAHLALARALGILRRIALGQLLVKLVAPVAPGIGGSGDALEQRRALPGQRRIRLDCFAECPLLVSPDPDVPTSLRVLP